MHVGLAGPASSGYSSGPIFVQTSLLPLMPLAILFGNLFPWSPRLCIMYFSCGGQAVHNNGTWLRGEGKMKSSLLCSLSPMLWPRLCPLGGRESSNLHKAMCPGGGPHCQLYFPSCLFPARFQLPILSQSLNVPWRAAPAISIHLPWVILTSGWL